MDVSRRLCFPQGCCIKERQWIKAVSCVLPRDDVIRSTGECKKEEGGCVLPRNDVMRSAGGCKQAAVFSPGPAASRGS